MGKHCCDEMHRNSTLDCDLHHDEYQCPDVLISYIDKFDEYGIIIHDGGMSSISIDYCPFCGAKLPESKRDMWFDELEAQGFDDPSEEDIPEQYKSDAWYRGK